MRYRRCMGRWFHRWRAVDHDRFTVSYRCVRCKATRVLPGGVL